MEDYDNEPLPQSTGVNGTNTVAAKQAANGKRPSSANTFTIGAGIPPSGLFQPHSGEGLSGITAAHDFNQALPSLNRLRSPCCGTSLSCCASPATRHQGSSQVQVSIFLTFEAAAASGAPSLVSRNFNAPAFDDLEEAPHSKTGEGIMFQEERCAPGRCYLFRTVIVPG